MCPTYRFENTETGEIFEKWMYMAEKEPYLKENPYIRPLIPTQMNVGEAGDWRDKLTAKRGMKYSAGHKKCQDQL